MTARPSVRVLGIDPGLRATGWGVLETAGDLSGSAARYGVIKPPTAAPIEQRLLVIQRELAALIDEWRPAVVVLERPFVRENVRSALALGQAQAAAMLAAAAAGLPLFEYAPREVKQAVSGDGNADKSALAQALTVQLGLDAVAHPRRRLGRARHRRLPRPAGGGRGRGGTAGARVITRIEGVARNWNADAQSVEVDVGGLWYEVLLPTYCWRAMEAQPEQVGFYTYYHVPDRNPTPVLYGFLRPVEREFFKKLMRVRNMGATKAQKALASSVSTIAHWIETEDKAALRQLPGIGARQADYVVAELKGKVVEEALLRDEQYREVATPAPPAQERALLDAVEALVNLGYARREAQAWVDGVADEELEPGAEAVLRAVFQKLAES